MVATITALIDGPPSATKEREHRAGRGAIGGLSAEPRIHDQAEKFRTQRGPGNTGASGC